VSKGLAALDAHWSYERGGTLHIQASESPVWDTLLALLAMQDCDRELTPNMQLALEWVLKNEVRYYGDWSKKVKGVEPSGWAFERANLNYPDIDDTAVALIVFARLPRTLLDEPRIRAVIDRALGWTLAMQSSNGGWAVGLGLSAFHETCLMLGMTNSAIALRLGQLNCTFCMRYSYSGGNRHGM
jgi:squalene-hopene/tetraprenyl-beta-curcumene cyclase